jgi:biotin carboxylase
MSEQPTIVCLASYFKGADFMRAAHEQGWRVVLVTKQQSENEAWPRDILADVAVVPDDADAGYYAYAAAYLARHHRVKRLVALDEYDTVRAATAREQLCLPGLPGATANAFHDKLLMRVKADAAGLHVPEFVHTLNHADIAGFLERVPSPWMLKPRADAASIGIQKLHTADEVWRAIEQLDASQRIKDRAAFYLLERYVAGDVFHVDALTKDGQVIFANASRYWRPPVEVAHGGGVFRSSTLPRGQREEKALLQFNRKIIKALGLTHGASHAEFIRSAADGQFYFLEIAARVGGAFLAECVEAASGVNLWREWAKIETDDDYELPPVRRDYGGLLVSLARQEWPDTSAYTDPEIFHRVGKRWHVGLVVSAPKLQRVESLLYSYAERFAHDFAAVAPPLEKPE